MFTFRKRKETCENVLLHNRPVIVICNLVVKMNLGKA